MVLATGVGENVFFVFRPDLAQVVLIKKHEVVLAILGVDPSQGLFEIQCEEYGLLIEIVKRGYLLSLEVLVDGLNYPPRLSCERKPDIEVKLARAFQFIYFNAQILVEVGMIEVGQKIAEKGVLEGEAGIRVEGDLLP